MPELGTDATALVERGAVVKAMAICTPTSFYPDIQGAPLYIQLCLTVADMSPSHSPCFS